MTTSSSDYNWKTFVYKEKRKYEPVGAKSFEFKNEDIQITYVPNIENAGTAFSIHNLSSKPIKIIWDETLFINESGESEQVFHSGVVIKDRTQHQVPSIILPKGKLTDEIISIDNVYFGVANWRYLPVCGTVLNGGLFTSRAFTLDAKSCENKTLGYFITYEIGGKKKTATVKFKYLGPDKSPEQKTAAANNP